MFPVHVPLPIIKCAVCGESFRVIPSFIIKGTILTITALVFVAFAYECKDSGLTWRLIINKFCKDTEKLSHSTIYTAVHKFGSLIAESEFFNKLKSLIPSIPEQIDHEVDRTSLKSKYEHTQKREKGVLKVTCLLELILSNGKGFLSIFLRYTEALQYLLKLPEYHLPKLYVNSS